jgi:hypothetical protein
MNTKFNVCTHIYVSLYSHCYNYNYSFIYLYKGYASYIHISRGYVKHERLRTTDLHLHNKHKNQIRYSYLRVLHHLCF